MTNTDPSKNCDRQRSDVSTESTGSTQSPQNLRSSVVPRVHVTTVLNPKTGARMTPDEVIADRKRQGLCVSCGIVQTHKKKFGGFKMVALNVEGKVENGVCLVCFNTQSGSTSRSGSTRFDEEFKPGHRNFQHKHTVLNRSSLSSMTSSVGAKSKKPARMQSLDEGEESSDDSLSGIGRLNSFGYSRSKSRRFSGKAALQKQLSEDTFDRTEPSLSSSQTSDPVRNSLKRPSLTKSDLSNIDIFNSSVKDKTYRNILDFERQNMEDGEKVAMALSELSNLTLEKYQNKKIDELSSMIKVLSRAVEFSNENSHLGEETCRLIRVLSETGDNERKKDLCVLGCGPVLISLMNAQPNNDGLQKLALKALSSLVGGQNSREYLAERPLMKCLCKTAGNEYLTLNSVHKSLELLVAIFVRTKKITKDDVELVMQAIKIAESNDPNDKVILCIFDIIEFIFETYPNDENVDLEKILFHMKTFEKNIKILDKGTQLFKLKAANCDCFVPPDNLFEFLNATLEGNEDNFGKNTSVVKLQENVLDLYIDLLTRGFFDRSVLKDLGLVKIIQKIVDSHVSGSRSNLIKGLKTLSLIPVDLVNSTETSKTLGLIAAIMDIYQDDARLIIESIRLFRKVVQNESSSPNISNANNVGILKSVMEQNMSNEPIMNAAMMVIQTMSSLTYCRSELEKHNIFDTLIKVMDANSDTRSVQVGGFPILCNLSIHPVSKKVIIISSQAMEVILRLMGSYPTEKVIQVNGCNLFKNSIFQRNNIDPLQTVAESLMEKLLAASGSFPDCEEPAFSVIQIVFG